MSTSAELLTASPVATVSDFLTQLFDVDPVRSRAFLDKADQALVSATEYFAPRIEPAIGHLLKFVEQLESAPKVDGHEELLVNLLYYDLLLARFFANFINQSGARWAAETNEGRQVNSLIGRLAKATGAGSLAVSRRASELSKLLRKGHGHSALWAAIETTSSGLSVAEFQELVERASNREIEACESLVKHSRMLIAHLSSPRGRPLAEATTIHACLLLFLRKAGHNIFYTYNPYSEKYDDEVTKSTSRAVNNEEFDPRNAVELMKSMTHSWGAN